MKITTVFFKKSYQCQLCNTRVEMYSCDLADYTCSKCHNKGTVIQITLANKFKIRQQAKATALLRRGVRNDSSTGLLSDRVRKGRELLFNRPEFPDYFVPDEASISIKRMIK